MHETVEFAKNRRGRITFKSVLMFLLVFAMVVVILGYITRRRTIAVRPVIENVKPGTFKTGSVDANRVASTSQELGTDQNSKKFEPQYRTEEMNTQQDDRLHGLKTNINQQLSLEYEDFENFKTSIQPVALTDGYVRNTVTHSSAWPGPATTRASGEFQTNTSYSRPSPDSHTDPISTPIEASRKWSFDYLKSLFGWKKDEDSETANRTSYSEDLSLTHKNFSEWNLEEKSNLTEYQNSLNVTYFANSSEPDHAGMLSNTSQTNLNQSLSQVIFQFPPPIPIPSKPSGPVFDTSLPLCDVYPSSELKQILERTVHTKGGSSWDVLRDFKRALHLRPMANLIAVGKELAAYGLLATNQRRRVVAVEPNHDCAKQLRTVIRQNEVHDKVAILEVAVLHKRGFGRFMSWGDRHFVGHVDAVDGALNSESNRLAVVAMTLDDLAGKLPFNEAILKIDIDSFQPSVFDAADRLFAAVRIRFIFMRWEYNPDNDSAATKIVDFLQAHDYEAREKLANGHSLVPSFFRYWPDHVVWTEKYPLAEYKPKHRI